MSRTKKKTKPIPRNGSATNRKRGGSIERPTPKGGAKNDQPELLAEAEEIATSMPVPMNETQVKQFVKDHTLILDDNEEDDSYC